MTQSIGLIIKHRHPEAATFAIEVAKFILSKNTRVIFASESKHLIPELKAQLKASGRVSSLARIKVVPKAKLVECTEAIIVLGGDGTLLSIARLMKTRSVPVMGINMGTLGFLTETKKSEAMERISELLDGKKQKISERALLEVTLKRGKKTIFSGPVVNDVVISKGAIARIIGMQIYMNGTYINTVRADGVILATPTGSTAYSLAAGGPILAPNLGALILTPICPHSLTQRPIVMRDDAVIEIRLTHRPGHVLLTLDGQDAVDMREGDVVIVKRFKKHSLKLISSPTRDYFSVLREKLKFGQRD
jgi:NAD+ kinase